MVPMPLTALEIAVAIASIAAPLVAAFVGLGQIAVVWYGIRAMVAANNASAEGAAAAARRAAARHAEAGRRADARHEENMAALKALIERTAPPKDRPRFRRQPARVL